MRKQLKHDYGILSGICKSMHVPLIVIAIALAHRLEILHKSAFAIFKSMSRLLSSLKRQDQRVQVHILEINARALIFRYRLADLKLLDLS